MHMCVCVCVCARHDRHTRVARQGVMTKRAGGGGGESLERLALGQQRRGEGPLLLVLRLLVLALQRNKTQPLRQRLQLLLPRGMRGLSSSAFAAADAAALRLQRAVSRTVRKGVNAGRTGRSKQGRACHAEGK